MNSDHHDNNVLAAIGSLREAGFALHWLHPRKKRPIGDGWSDAPVASLAALRSSHAPGNNLGVRLGEPSRLACSGYLHVFDLDIRVPDLAEEAWDAFAKLFPGVNVYDLPCVASGSGGESRHLYFITDKAFRSKRLAVSEGKHRSKDGKWHYDWEIELFGTGKQVAMPPSIHPDTGQPYAWLREFDFDGFESPEIPSSDIESLAVAEHSTYEFEDREPLTFKPGQIERELDLIPVSDLHYDDWIRLGQALHHQFGGSQEGLDLWLHHTKRSTKFTGEKQIREMRRSKWRSFGKYRGQPVTMATVRQWAQEARLAGLADEFDDFDDDSHSTGSSPESAANLPKNDDFLDDPSSPESDDFDELLTAESGDDDDLAAFDLTPEEKAESKALNWTSLLDVNEEGAFKPTLHNVELIVRNDPRLVDLIQLNEFTQETVQRTQPGRKNQRKNSPKDTRQLDGRVWKVEDTLNGDLWSDDRDFAIRSIIEAPKTQGGYALKVSDRDLKAAVVLAANGNAFHPVREYLNGLKWDGNARVDRLWIDYVNASDDAYHRAVARLVMIAAVTRIFEPGHKFDFATILEGLQGKRKSTLIAVLGCHWFGELDGEFSDQKTMIELMQGKWLMEIPELTGFSRADVRAIKAFISRQKDRARLAYARRAGEFPRQCIFIGSTNDREYLKDDTGGRRFWPVECKLGPDEEIDTDSLERNVDQLWAEAVALYRQMRKEKPRGTLPLYLTDRDARATAARLQESRRQENPDDVLAGRIAAWLEKPIQNGGFDEPQDGLPRYRNETCTAEIWVECLGKDLSAFKFQEQGSVNRALAKVPGWGAAGSKRFDLYGKQRYFARGGAEGVLARSAIGDLLND